MTRLVGVRAVCDVCSAARAVVFCVVHRHVACAKCDAESHRGAAANHQRVDLAGAVTALPFCDKCDNAPATSYCESESVTLCAQCDVAVHAHKSCASHHRRLISKAIAQRNISFIGTPTGNSNPNDSVDPPSSKSITLNEPSASAPSVEQGASPPPPKPEPIASPPIKPRIRNASSPMKRSRRDQPPPGSSNEGAPARGRRARPRQTPVRLSPAPMPTFTSTSANLFREPNLGAHPIVNAPPPLGTPMTTPDNTLAYIQAMYARDPVGYFANTVATSQQYFMPPELLAATFQPAQPTTPTHDLMQIDTSARDPPIPGPAPTMNQQSMRQRQQPYTTIAPVSTAPALTPLAPRPVGAMDPVTMAAAAAAAATAAGEMCLLNASDVQGSGSSDQLTPPFRVPPEAVTAAAANAADQYLVQQARRRGTPPTTAVMPQPPMTGSPQIGTVDEEFTITDFDIPRSADDFVDFGTIDLSSFEPPPNFNDDNAPRQ